jgi:hypothetical protein
VIDPKYLISHTNSVTYEAKTFANASNWYPNEANSFVILAKRIEIEGKSILSLAKRNVNVPIRFDNDAKGIADEDQ